MTLSTDSGRGKSRGILFLDGTWCVYTNTVDQGSTDSAHAFQAGMMEVFEDMLYICVLIWIDDVWVYTRRFEDLLTGLEEVFQSLGKFNVKLNPQKTDSAPRRSPGVAEKFLFKVSSSIQR